jgi:hypothetical protein
MDTILSAFILLGCIFLLFQCTGVFTVVNPIFKAWAKDKFISGFGWFVSRRPVFNFISWYARRTPHTHLYDTLAQPEAGEHTSPLYMGRWCVVNRGSFGSWLLKLVSGYESCRLHYIARPDHDRDLHNHPFRYRTFILSGWYRSVVQPVGWALPYVAERLNAGDSDSMDVGDWHRIALMHPSGVWTLFFMTDNTEEWGFLTQEGYVESREYFRRKRAD